MIAVNEQIVAQGSRFSLEGVEVVTATIDLDQVHAYRSATSRSIQATMVPEYPRVHTDDSWPEFTLSAGNELDVELAPSTPIRLRIHSPEEEIALVAGAYLWHYLRRCDAAGYLVPLSGGIDSCATAVAVFSMCRLAIEACEAGNETVIADVQRIARYSERLPKTPQELCNQILHTVYMGVKAHSSKETRSRAQELSKAIGSHHIDTDVGDVFDAHRSLIANALGFEPQFKVHGGSAAENVSSSPPAMAPFRKRDKLSWCPDNAAEYPGSEPHGDGVLVRADSANSPAAARRRVAPRSGKHECRRVTPRNFHQV